MCICNKQINIYIYIYIYIYIFVRQNFFCVRFVGSPFSFLHVSEDLSAGISINTRFWRFNAVPPRCLSLFFFLIFFAQLVPSAKFHLPEVLKLKLKGKLQLGSREEFPIPLKYRCVCVCL
ncbi:hypothetical protein, unlikely [Trypanosoma brucei gambiense DAL972]|uniref:Uncharacterized protein n=1 Tax=Trypanosoma brucei gambiense (strain MHOM/CI/86/DAL972) TaxID=679716 RepID=D0A249_TRYB9|nr:hypothetical protein, unlikely [Trypanosoma brucei gambiense DAL972]CBH15342.1 hypothetical protein, unlikely [Trypanosoma brucei gambiense DAL972]|eukprot:XP_011777607.1 hypothetical protein, unlikely [Trypanosoma brucei gambiense DAL972]